MVVTMLEARVEPDRVEELERTFREQAVPLPSAIYETFLLRDTADGSLIRIFTVWSSRPALDAMREEARAAGVKLKGVQILEAVGADPRLNILDVAVHHIG